MPKRKRSVAEAVQNKLEKYRIEIFRALSSAKVFERKRFSNKLHEPGITVAKKTRLEREYAVLKSLDLRQTARHHLHSNLLRIKAVETSNDIPEELRAAVPRPTLSPEEIALQNNVISILCNAAPARHALDRAITDICETLGVPVPTKSKRVRNKRKDTEEQPADREDGEDGEEDGNEADGEGVKASTKSKKQPEDAGEDDADESEFEGFGSDADEPRPTIEELEESDQETAVTKYDDLLGGSSDDDEEEFDEELLAKYRGTEQVNLDDISVSGSGSEDEDDDEEEPESITGSRSPSPLPTKRLKRSADSDDTPKPETAKSSKEAKELEKKKRAAKAAVKTARLGDSTFLPTLMGGYISGSESASDIEAPPKKRRGQRARQAIWEKKYGANAKHLQKAATKGGRDAGWDMKRGAVGPEDQGRGKGWKRGGRPLGRPAGGENRGYSQGRGGNAHQESRVQSAPKPVKKDNEGPLHPSWEARKKAKEAQKGAAFAGSKIVFD